MAAPGKAAERRAQWWYRMRGYRVLAVNAWIGGYELDLVVRRGRRLVFCEVKEKNGPLFGSAVEMVDEEKQRRVRLAAEGWIASNGRGWPRPRTPSTRTSTSSSRGPSRTCRNASGRGTFTGCTRTWGNSSP